MTDKPQWTMGGSTLRGYVEGERTTMKTTKVEIVGFDPDAVEQDKPPVDPSLSPAEHLAETLRRHGFATAITELDDPPKASHTRQESAGSPRE